MRALCVLGVLRSAVLTGLQGSTWPRRLPWVWVFERSVRWQCSLGRARWAWMYADAVYDCLA